MSAAGPTLALLLVSLLWGTTFVAVKAGLGDASPLVFVAVRFSIAAAGTLLLFPRKARAPGALRPGIPLGVVLALAYAAQTLGLETTTPSRSAFVTGVNVAVVPLWAMALLGKPPRPLAILGLLVAVPGLWLLTSPEGSAWNRGDSWTLACAVLFALHVVLLNRLAPGKPVAALLLVQVVVTAVLCGAAAVLLEEVRFRPTPQLAAALLMTGLLATTVTTWLQIRFQPAVDPTRAALVYATEPVFAAGLSWIVFGETLGLLAWIGGALILAGMLCSEIGNTGRS